MYKLGKKVKISLSFRSRAIQDDHSRYQQKANFFLTKKLNLYHWLRDKVGQQKVMTHVTYVTAYYVMFFTPKLPELNYFLT